MSGELLTVNMSGDHGREHYDDVNDTKDYAISKGVPSDDIFTYHVSFSTYESMLRASDIFQCERIIFVTQSCPLYCASTMQGLSKWKQ